MTYIYTPPSADLLSGCACAILFILLLSLDAWKAIKTKSHWFPAKFLVLSALTLQFINWVDYSAVNVTSGTGQITGDDVADFLKIQLVIESGRLVICVFIAYLLPRLVGSDFRSISIDIGALALHVLAHVFSEIFLLAYIRYHPAGYHEVWFEVFSVILFTAIILLVLLSICVVLAGKTIRVIMNQNVRPLLSCCSNSRRGCTNIGDHVLKCWIVVRSGQHEYIIARSVLSSFTGLLVTGCVITIVVKWSCVYKHDYKALNSLNKITFLLQFLFALIGGIVVFLRWLKAVIYFPRVGQSLFKVEDFWTRSLTDFKYGQLKGRLFREKRNRKRTLLEAMIMDLIIALRLHFFLLSIAILLQKFIVLLCKASSFFSSILFFPFLKIREKIVLLSGSNIPMPEFSNYRQLLEMTRMPGETAESLWRANESAFVSTKKHMQQSMRRTEDLIEIIRRLQTESPAADEANRRRKRSWIYYAGKRSWKLRVVSLIHLMLCSYDDNSFGVVDDAFTACSEAWPLMDIVDESSNKEANSLSHAADKEFDTLEYKWKKHLKMKPIQSEPVRTIRDQMKEDMKSRIRNVESEERVDDMHDSIDRMTAAANFSLKKTSEGIDLRSPQAIDNLRSLLATVIIDCLENELNKALIKKCNEWAVYGEEQEIYDAAFIAGKAMAMLDLFKRPGKDAGRPPVAEGEGNDASGQEPAPDREEDCSSAIAKAIAKVGEAIVDVASGGESESDGEENISNLSTLEMQ